MTTFDVSNEAETALALRNDGSLLEIMGSIQDGMLANPFTGQGTSRDVEQHTYLQLPDRLSEAALRTLYRDWFVQRVVNLYPQEMTRKDWLKISLPDKSDRQLAKVISKLESLGVRKAFRDAAMWAALFGGSCIFIAANKNKDINKPLTPESIKSIEYLRVLDRHQIRPAIGQTSLLDPEFYQVVITPDETLVAGDDSGFAREMPVKYSDPIHKSRVLRFDGDPLPPVDRNSNDGWCESVIQKCYTIFKRHYEGGGVMGQILRTLSTLNLSMGNLGDLIANGQGEAVKKHYREVSMMVSVFNALLTDSSIESASYIGRSMAGVPEAIQSFRDELTAAADYPHYKIWGSVGKAALADSGGAESQDWGNRVYQRQDDKFGEPLQHFLPLVMACPDVLKRVPSGWSFDFNPVVKPNAKELLEQESGRVSNYEKLLTNGVIKAKEWREAIASGQPIEAVIKLEPEGESEEDNEIKQPPNGAQIQAIVDAIKSAAAGELPRDSAVQIIKAALVIPEKEAERIVGSAGEPKEGEPAAGELDLNEFEGELEDTPPVEGEAVPPTEPATPPPVEEESLPLAPAPAQDSADRVDAVDPETLDRVYSRYKEMVNMSVSELEDWAQTEASKRASLDRSPINRNLELLRTPKAEWTEKHISWANKTIAFVGRMSKAEQGQPVSKDVPYSKRDISLRNWAYNPSKQRTDAAPLRVGSTVSWNYGTGKGEGKIVKVHTSPIALEIKGVEIKRNGTPDNPAYEIEQENGDRVLKLPSEVERDG